MRYGIGIWVIWIRFVLFDTSSELISLFYTWVSTKQEDKNTKPQKELTQGY